MQREKSESEIADELQDQIHFLRKSAEEYDSGEIREAKRLAATLYILLHDGPQNKSLLKSARIRSKMNFLSTAMIGPPDGSTGGVWISAAPPLCMVQMSASDANFIPHCSNRSDPPPQWARALSFSNWWSESVASAGRRDLSRKGLVFLVRSQDGGGHVDRKRKGESYLDFLDQPAGDGVTFHRSTGEEFVPGNPHLASIRQIAWEVDHALSNFGL